MNILVTGGAGYIGSRTAHFLLEAGHKVVVVDNLSRGNRAAVPEKAEFIQMDIADFGVRAILRQSGIDAVIHFAAYAYVGESTQNPGLYYTNNTAGTVALLNSMQSCNVSHMVFSSTCSLYGNPERVPITEDEPVKPINPYAASKWMVERILEDIANSSAFRYCALRYFNAAGASPDGTMGESHEPEQHLIPLVIAAADSGKAIKVFGQDYPTPDGTCIRDYIHIDDLASAHIRALEYICKTDKSAVVNLGTGTGTSVREIVELCSTVMKKEIAIEVVDRRAGDPAVLVADNRQAKSLLGWSPQYGIKEIISHAAAWHKNKRY